MQRFGPSCVFMDVDSIEPGVDFVDAIDQALARCTVLLALIGPHWLEASDRGGARRIDQADDFVRREISVALESGMRVIPLLVRGAQMPEAPQLNDALAPLARCQAVELSDRLWHESVASLVELVARSASPWDGEAPTLPVGTEVPLPTVLAVARTGAFAGRDEPMIVLQETWRAQAAVAMPMLVTVAGEPGIGKTRLVSEFSARARSEDATVLAGRCMEEPLRVYEPFAEMLVGYGRACERGLVSSLGDLASPLAPMLPAQVAPAERYSLGSMRSSLDAADDRAATFDAFIELISRIGQASPVVMVLEDLHWATAPTLALLRHVLEADHALPVLVVATYRDTELDRMHPLAALLADLRAASRVARISLKGLDEDAIAVCVAAQGAVDVRPTLGRELLEQTDGNPFFVGELLRNLLEDPTAGSLPEGVREVVGRRLGRLPESVTTTLRVAAVIGSTFSLRLLQAVRAVGAEPDDLIDALDRSLAARLIVEEHADADVRYTFAHALVRHTLYDELSTARRARVHGQVVAAIEVTFGEDAEWLPALAYHSAEAARAGDVERALRYACRAAEVAFDRIAFEESVTIARRGLELADLDRNCEPGVRCELLCLVCEAETFLGHATYDAQRALAAQALESARLVNDADLVARAATSVLWASDGTTLSQGDDAEKEQLITDAVRLIGDRRSREVVEFLAFAGNYYTWAPGRRAEGERLIADALERARELDDKRALGNALEWAVQIQWGMPTRRALQRGLLKELREVCESTGDPLLWSQYCGDAVNLALVEADPNVRSYVARFVESLPGHERSWSSYYLYVRGCVAMLDGDFASAERFNESGLADARGGGFVATGLAQLFLLRREQGRLDEIESIADSALETAPGLVGFRVAVALARLDVGKVAGVQEEVARLAADDFSALPRDMTWPVSLCLFAELSNRLDDPALARATYAELLPFAGELVVAGICAAAVGAVDRGLGQCATMLGEHDAVVAHFETALKLEERIGSPPLAARTKFWFAQGLSRRRGPDDAARAAALLRDVIETSDRIGMRKLSADARVLASTIRP
jgi:tetratricopeptide (TPR) repeat protein